MDLTSLNKDRKKRKPSIDMSTMMYGKVPPQAKELEEMVLGAIMLARGVFDAIVPILKAECFYVEANQLIFKAMESMQAKYMPIDIQMVVEELKVREQLDAVGGPYYVVKLTNSVVSTANVESHARIVLQKFIQRELIRISGEIIGDAYEDSTDVFDLLDESETKIFNITNNYLKTDNMKTSGQLVAVSVNKVDQLRASKEEITGVPSGFRSLDRVTYGWQPTDLIILAARPSVGKTAFALNLARNAALHPTKPVPVGFFSLEMSASQLIDRILSAESEIKLEQINRGKMNDGEYMQYLGKGVKRLEIAPIFIDDSAAINIFEFRSKARRLVNKHHCGLIIIDYLQLMSGTKGSGQNREQEISNISRNLKALAKELNVPIIALSQLSRAVETRKESKMPQLSDLRESGAIEQDADMVMFIYRPEYYEVMNNEHGESTSGETHIRIAKHRNGSLETIKLLAKLDIQKFEECDLPGSNWKSVGEPKLFIHTGSKLKTDDFDSGFENKTF